MSHPTERFALTSRVLHWGMAALVLVMLLIGIGMVSTTGPGYYRLLSVHRSIGIAVLVLVAVRLVNRLIVPPPPLPRDLPGWQKTLAFVSHGALYTLMIALPLLGWAMLSAGNYPIQVFGIVYLPPIVAPDAALFGLLRTLHTVFALLLFAIFLTHLGAALFHGWIRRDGVLESMA